MTTLVVWTGTKCIGIFRHQLSIVSGEFYLAQHFLETIVGATLGVGGGGGGCKQSVFGEFEN